MISCENLFGNNCKIEFVEESTNLHGEFCKKYISKYMNFQAGCASLKGVQSWPMALLAESMLATLPQLLMSQ
jgi:hypothetical protein